MKIVLVLIGLFVAFVPGAALFDEHAAGWDGFLPVGIVRVSSSFNAETSHLAVDSEPETLWIGPRGAGRFFDVEFHRPQVLCGIWTDNGNSYRLTPGTRIMRVTLDPPPKGMRFVYPHAASLFGVWSQFSFAPQEVSSLRIECFEWIPGGRALWALRDLRFMSPGSFHWSHDGWLAALGRLPVPAAVAGAWCVLLWWLARRTRGSGVTRRDPRDIAEEGAAASA